MHDVRVPSDRRPERVALVAFCALTGWLNLRHEPWHDELQAWRIALDSRTIAELLGNLRYEGHPPLYYLLLRLVGAFTPAWSPVVVLHWMVACLSAWLVLWHAPFTRLQRILVTFGYFVVYEYAVIVRPYGLGMCLALGACMAWSGVPRRPRVAALLLTLLATTSAMGLVLAVPIGIALLADGIASSGGGWWTDRVQRRRVLVAAAALSAVAVVVAAFVAPPPDAIFQVDVNPFSGDRLWRIGTAMSVPARVLLPLAELQPDGSTRWSSWLFALPSRQGMLIADIVSLVALALMTTIVARRRAALLLWIASGVCLLGFFAFVFGGGTRHHGYLVVAFLAAAWLAFAPDRDLRRGPVAPERGLSARWRSGTLTLLLALMVLPSVQFAIAETREPFSDAGQVADLLSRDSLAAAPIVGLAFPWSQPVAAMLGRPVTFPAESRRATWVARRNVVEGPREKTLADSAVRALLTAHCRVVVLSSRGNPHEQFDWPGARELPLDAGTPMAGDPLRVWVVTAPRCAGPARGA